MADVNARELRTNGRSELRLVDDEMEVRIAGYALLYDVPYTVGTPPAGFVERVAPGAAARAANEDDVRLLVNHEGVPLGRTRAGTLALTSDAIGLRVDATLDATNPRVAEVASALRRGDLDAMSFAFRAIKQSWSDDFNERTLEEIELFDVALVTYPANDATVAMLTASRSRPIRGGASVALRRRELSVLLAPDPSGDQPRADAKAPEIIGYLDGGPGCWNGSALSSARRSKSETTWSSGFASCSTRPIRRAAQN